MSDCNRPGPPAPAHPAECPPGWVGASPEAVTAAVNAAGGAASDVARRLGVKRQTVYAWRANGCPMWTAWYTLCALSGFDAQAWR